VVANGGGIKGVVRQCQVACDTLEVIKAQLAGRRRGTAKTKTKAEVRGGGRKPFRQKGTGNARRGSTRSPLIAGGGQTFGPLPRDYSQRTPKEMMRGALRSALSDRVKAGRLLLVDEFKLADIKTKTFTITNHNTTISIIFFIFYIQTIFLKLPNISR